MQRRLDEMQAKFEQAQSLVTELQASARTHTHIPPDMDEVMTDSCELRVLRELCFFVCLCVCECVCERERKTSCSLVHGHGIRE